MIVLKLLAWVVLIVVGFSTIADFLRFMSKGVDPKDWIDQALTTGAALLMILIYLGSIWVVANGKGC